MWRLSHAPLPAAIRNTASPHRNTSIRAATGSAVLLLIASLIALAGCAPKEPANDPGSTEQSQAPAIEIAWSPDMDCSTCHASEQESYSDSQCEASLHSDVTCIQCHADDTSLASVHEGKTASDKMPTRLKKTNVEDGVCFDCHYGNRSELIAATNGSVSLTDSQGTSRNPHDPEGISDHETLSCRNCHNMHSNDNIQERALKECESCHHAGVFECYTCHE